MSEISPLFAVEAEQLMLAGEVDEAVRLCLEGLDVYPGYSAAYLILIRSFREKGKYDDAMDIIRKAEEKFPRNPGIIALKSELRSASKEISTPALDPENASETSNNTNKENISLSEGIEENQNSESFKKVKNQSSDEIIPVIDEDTAKTDEDVIAETDNEKEEPVDFEDKVIENDADFDVDAISKKFETQKESDKTTKGLPLSILLDIDPGEQYESSKTIKHDDPNLIPGIDFSPLGISTDNITIPELKSTPVFFPPFPEFSRGDFDLGGVDTLSTVKRADNEDSIPTTLSGPSQTIEELARRLESLKKEGSSDIKLPESELKKPVVTETIADIFISQGLYDAAIDAFNELITSYPDKKEYFISRISETRELQNPG